MSLPWYLLLLVALFVVGIPFILGSALTRRWRMTDYFGKVTLILLCISVAAAIVVLRWPPKLAIDLRGGVQLIYEVESTQGTAAHAPGQTAEDRAKVDMDKLIGAIGRRVNPAGLKEVTVRKYGPQQVEIIVPEIEEAQVERLKRILQSVGTLEFRILATTYRHKSLIDRAQALPTDVMELRDPEGNLQAFWVPVAEDARGEFNYPYLAQRTGPYRGKEREQVLVIRDDQNVTGEYLTRAGATIDEKAQPAVSFNFTSEGGRRFGILTGRHTPNQIEGFSYHLGIILDSELRSAPTIRSTIFDSGQITGNFTEEEVDKYVQVLNAGALPATLTKLPISELYMGPTLGSDTIRMGTNAMIASVLMVAVFMLIYYRFSGVVANLAMAMNVLLLFAMMLAIPEKVALSLPGLAGIALTIGMAVDANVLIYERMREELDRGATLRMAIRNGFDRAQSAIIDSNVTTLASAAVLYAVGSEQIKGFAVTLFLGLLISLFTAVFCAHVLFDVAERQGWISKLKMMRILSRPNLDFWGFRKRAYTLSIVIVLIGLVAVAMRGRGLLDIDFTGGVSVQTEFQEPQNVADVRRSLEEQKMPDLVVSDVKSQGRDDERPGFRRRYVINTSFPETVDPSDPAAAAVYMVEVERQIEQAFGERLAHNSLTVAELKPVEAAKPRQPAEKPESKPATKSQTRNDLPEDTILASADPAHVLLAQAAPVKPADAPAPAKQADKPTEKPAEKAADKPAEKPAEKPADKPTEKPADKPTEKPADKPTEKPADKPAEKAAEKPVEKPVQASSTPQAASRFEGGTLATLNFAQPVDRDTVENFIRTELEAGTAGVKAAEFQVSFPGYVEGETVRREAWDVKIALPQEKAKTLFANVTERVSTTPFFPSANSIGGKVAGGTRVRAIYAIIVSNLLIMVYLWIRFQRLGFGVAAVIALVHDVLVTLGLLAISKWIAPFTGFLLVDPFKIGLTEVAALLTIVGFSVNDTVVIFDRIREIKGKAQEVTPEMINAAVNQTLSRTILTSSTAIMVVMMLYVFGGPTIHGFSFALLIGMLSGVYSTVYVAAPLLLFGKKHAVASGAGAARAR